MNNCQHHSRQGDNYGETCMDCGAQLAGYGNWAEGDGTCHHSFVDYGEKDKAGAKLETCMYCEITQPAVAHE